MCAESAKWPDGRNNGHTRISVISAICRSGYFQQPMQPRRLCMLSLHVDSTTATHCCTVLPTHYSGGCSPYITLLPAWSRVHGDGITLLQFWGTSVGSRRHLTLVTIAYWLPLTSFAAVCIQPTSTHASSRGPEDPYPLWRPEFPRCRPPDLEDWNSLPPELRRPDTELGEFRRLLKTFLFA